MAMTYASLAYPLSEQNTPMEEDEPTHTIDLILDNDGIELRGHGPGLKKSTSCSSNGGTWLEDRQL